MALEKPEDSLSVGEIFQRTGMGVAEITFRTDAAPQGIRLMKREFPHLLVGAGTITTLDQLKTAVDCGCDFLVSPGFNPPIVEEARKRGILLIPGVNTPSLVEQAMWGGLQYLKFFPAQVSGGTPMLKALKAVYPGVGFMPTGGITPANLGEYLLQDNVFACGGSWMVTREDLGRKNWEGIERKVREALALVKNTL